MNISCIAFDFDGTLIRSNRIKRTRLYDTVADIPLAAEILDDMHEENFIGDRYEIFQELCGRLGLEDKENAKNLIRIYGNLCHQSLIECEEIPGTTVAIKDLKQSGVSLYIVSATPQLDLVPIVKCRGLTPYFQAVLGRPTGKIEHLKAIMKAEQIDAGSLVMIGDGMDDLTAAKAIGCHFIAITDDPLVPLSGDHIAVPDLENIKSAFAGIKHHSKGSAFG